jgi:plastocyanin
MNRRAFLQTLPRASAGVAAGVSLAGCQTDSDYDVWMQSNAFVPSDVEVTVGEEVVWRNNGARNHTVTAYEQTLPEDAAYFASGDYSSEDAARHAWENQIEDAGNIRPDEEYRHTFEVPGTFAYFCIPHEPAGMVGTVTVTE